MTKTQKAEIARALAALRKTYGGPPPKCHPDEPDPNCERCKKRLAQRRWRRGTVKHAGRAA
jgi:Mg-chelatase subunit ChlI